MDFRDTPEEAEYRAKTRAWLQEHCPVPFLRTGLLTGGPLEEIDESAETRPGSGAVTLSTKVAKADFTERARVGELGDVLAGRAPARSVDHADRLRAAHVGGDVLPELAQPFDRPDLFGYLFRAGTVGERSRHVLS